MNVHELKIVPVSFAASIVFCCRYGGQIQLRQRKPCSDHLPSNSLFRNQRTLLKWDENVVVVVFFFFFKILSVLGSCCDHVVEFRTINENRKSSFFYSRPNSNSTIQLNQI